MIILPQIKELQRANLSDIHGNGGSLPSGYYRNITGTFNSLGNDITDVMCINFDANIINTGPSIQNSYSYTYPANWPAITENNYSTVPSVTLNSGSAGNPGGTGGGGGGTAGGGATSGGNGARGGNGGPGLAGRRWDEQTLANNNTGYGTAGSGGAGALGQPGESSVNGQSGSNGTPGSSGGGGGSGGSTSIPTPQGGLGGAGGGGGGGGQTIFIRYSYPSYVNQNMDTLTIATTRFHGPGGNGASGYIAGGGGANGGTGGIPATTWPTTFTRSGGGGLLGVLSPSSDALEGGAGGTVEIRGPNASNYPGSGSSGDLGSPEDVFSFFGEGTAGTNGINGNPGTGISSGQNGTIGNNGGTGGAPSAGGGGGGRGGRGGDGIIQSNGAPGGAGGVGGPGGAGGKPGKSLGLLVYNRIKGSINTSGYYGPSPLGTFSPLGNAVIHPSLGSYFGTNGGAGGNGGYGGQGSSGRILLVGRYTQYYNNPNFIMSSTPSGSNGPSGDGGTGGGGSGGIWTSFGTLSRGTDGEKGVGGSGGNGNGITSPTPGQTAFYILT
jgi:hypothetical protein